MRILFISEFQANTIYTHSTNIVVYNLLKAFSDISIEFNSILIYDFDQNIKDVKTSLLNEGVPIESIQFIQTRNPIREKKNIIGRYIELFRKAYTINYYSSIKDKILFKNKNFDLIITHSPAIDSIALFKTLYNLKLITYKKYFQLWSDPIAAAGVRYNKLNYRRRLLKIIENHLYSSPDKIFFFTETLFLSQNKIYNNKKFEPVNLFFDIKNSIYFKNRNEINIQSPIIHSLYFGNYSLKNRDIRPLYNFMTVSENHKLTIIGESKDLSLVNNSNVEVINHRFPKDELYKKIQYHNFIIAILNKNTIQIPGKIFFDSNIPYPFLVLLDGPYKNQIKNYLQRFNRFYFAENSLSSIKLFFDNYNYNMDNFHGNLIDSPTDVVNRIISFYNFN